MGFRTRNREGDAANSTGLGWISAEPCPVSLRGVSFELWRHDFAGLVGQGRRRR